MKTGLEAKANRPARQPDAGAAAQGGRPCGRRQAQPSALGSGFCTPRSEAGAQLLKDRIGV